MPRTPSPQRVSLRPLQPLWPEAPRLCPDRELPAYRFVPGLNPHPVEDPAGHSHGVEPAPASCSPPERWRENVDYLYGIDLYHQGYLWESHEVWEGLWKCLNRESIQAQFLQGLIQNSAAQLKAHVRSARGARTLSRRACLHLEKAQAAGAGARYMGLDLADLLAQMRTHYGPLWTTDDVVRLNGTAPRLAPG